MRQYSYQPILQMRKIRSKRGHIMPQDSVREPDLKSHNRTQMIVLLTPKSFFEIVLGVKFKTEGNTF